MSGVPTPAQSSTVIRQLTSHLTIFSAPFSRGPGVKFGGRSTAVKLANGDVWVAASTSLDQPTRQTLGDMGDVKYIVGLDAVHWLHLKDFKAAFPAAKVIGVDGLQEKVPDLQFDGLYGKDPEGTKYGFEPEIEAVYFSGFKNKDVAFFHAPSKTLIEADLLFNLPATEQYSKSGESATSVVPGLGNLHPGTKTHKLFARAVGTNKEAMTRDAKKVASWDFERIVPCHGDVIEKDAKKAWLDAYSAFLEG